MTNPTFPDTTHRPDTDEGHISELIALTRSHTHLDVINTLEKEPDAVIGQVLAGLQPPLALKVLNHLPEAKSQAIVEAFDFPCGKQWSFARQYPKDSLGRLMSPAHGVFHADTTVRAAIDEIRELVETVMITYGYIVDTEERLQGVLVMRDLMLAEPEQQLHEIMIDHPFSLRPTMSITDAMTAMVRRHYPVYPVCDDDQKLIGAIQGFILFEEHAFDLSAQSGRMVGVEKEEHLTTSWAKSLKFRHPWLQLNLLTAFVAAFVVGIFEDTIAQVVLLAVFLPVLAGQSGNTGCQSLAVTLRGMTLGEMKEGFVKKITAKEALLGFLNGVLVGVTAAIAMFVYANMNDNPQALMLALVVFLAMVGSCVISGISGVLVPVTLKRLGADPATASSIFLTTSTDVASMGLFLWLATVIVL